MSKSPQPSQESRPQIAAAIPAFNEERYIGTIVLKTKKHVDEVVVVDDGSTDKTADVAELAGARVIRHGQNKGYGASIQTLLSDAKEKNQDILILLDGDFQHNPDEIPQLIKPISEGYDLIIGSRKEQWGNIPRYRRLGQRMISYFSRILSRKNLYDSESGFRVFSRNAIEKLELKENGMAVSAETIVRAADKDLRIIEKPISIIYTKDGSTLHPVLHGFEVLGRIIAMISERRPLFFFGLGGAILTGLGLLTGIRVLTIAWGGGEIATGTALLAILLLIVGILSIFTGIILNVLTKWRH